LRFFQFGHSKVFAFFRSSFHNAPFLFAVGREGDKKTVFPQDNYEKNFAFIDVIGFDFLRDAHNVPGEREACLCYFHG
jgi:hypothetical protein